MKEYRIIQAMDLLDFNLDINNAIDNGCILIGGVSISHDSSNGIYWYAQAVAKPVTK